MTLGSGTTPPRLRVRWLEVEVQTRRREEKGRSEVSKQSSSGHRATIVPAKGYKRLRFARTKEHEIFPSLQCSVRSPIDPEGSCPPPPSLPFPLPSLLPPQDGLFKYFEA